MEYLPPPADHEPSPPPVKRRGAASGIGALVAAAVAFLAKFKLAILLALKLSAPAWTFLLSLWLYVALFGWRFALVILALLVVHEFGHYIAFRGYGMPVRLPTFVPLLGAFTAGVAPNDLEQDAYIALAGPLAGLGLAGVCSAIGATTGSPFWYACANVGAFLNLFNMIPMPPFDGGRVIAAFHPLLWFIGFALFVAFAYVFHIPLLFVVIIGVLGLPAMWRAWRGHVDPRAATLTNAARLRIGLAFLATLFGLLLVMAQSHVPNAPAPVSPSW